MERIVGVSAHCADDCKLARSDRPAALRQHARMINDKPLAPPRTPADRDEAQTARRYFVSRHPGAIAWAHQHPWAARAEFVTHLDPRIVAPGDVVIGTLPVHLAAQVCARGARYLHLTLDLEAAQRGSELSTDELDAAGAHLTPYTVTRGRMP